jgi:uncharacterized hydrophobic protein (TIGR00271 family)
MDVSPYENGHDVRMLALRVLCPSDVTPDVLSVLRRHPAATHVVVHRGAAVEPAGDVLLADVAREAVSEVLAELQALPAAPACAFTLDSRDTSLSRYADEAERLAPGLGVDAVVWEEVAARTNEESSLSASFLALMVASTLMASIALLLDSAVLIVGAMVVGPEYGPIAGLTVATVQRRWHLARRSAVALAVAFPLASLAALALTLAVRATGSIPASYSEGARPVTQFVSHPDGWALLVALLAGVAGIVSLTSAKSAALVGVAVSVTTMPAAANIGVAAATGRWSECGGAALQLGINLTALVGAGLATLVIRTRGSRR